jgi:hypothetical protein
LNAADNLQISRSRCPTARARTTVFGDSSEFNALGDSGAKQSHASLDSEEAVRGWRSPDFVRSMRRARRAFAGGGNFRAALAAGDVEIKAAAR